MGKLVLDRLEAGMVLASDVHDRSGRLLLGAGTELTQKHLHIFRTWGVEDVDIAGVEDGENTTPLPPEVTKELLDASEALLRPLFQHANPDHPAMKELFRLAVLRKVQHARQ